ncbi:TerD family protein [Streptomyces hayashii]|uniref:TerD family protein n=1 Tax=Streptomyces hayashii TaxID=2839966 RepID=UPI00403C073A
MFRGCAGRPTHPWLRRRRAHQWQAEITQASGAQLAFAPGPFWSGETVSIAVELDRHTASWKVRAVGQGYDTGLAGLAFDYGIDVEA